MIFLPYFINIFSKFTFPLPSLSAVPQPDWEFPSFIHFRFKGLYSCLWLGKVKNETSICYTWKQNPENKHSQYFHRDPLWHTSMGSCKIVSQKLTVKKWLVHKQLTHKRVGVPSSQSGIPSWWTLAFDILWWLRYFWKCQGSVLWHHLTTDWEQHASVAF